VYLRSHDFSGSRLVLDWVFISSHARHDGACARFVTLHTCQVAFKAPIRDPNPKPAADEVANLDVQSSDMLKGGNDYRGQLLSYFDSRDYARLARGELEESTQTSQVTNVGRHGRARACAPRVTVRPRVSPAPKVFPGICLVSSSVLI